MNEVCGEARVAATNEFPVRKNWNAEMGEAYCIRRKNLQ
jgi:hypothetical protein